MDKAYHTYDTSNDQVYADSNVDKEAFIGDTALNCATLHCTNTALGNGTKTRRGILDYYEYYDVVRPQQGSISPLTIMGRLNST